MDEHDTELSDILVQLQDPDPTARRLAVMALDDLADPEALPALLITLRDPDAMVRRLTVGVLEELGDPRAVGPLIAALEDADGAVRGAAKTALRELRCTEAADTLIAAITHPHPEVRQAVIMALRELRVPQAVAALITTLADPHPEVRREGVTALGYLKDPQALPALQAALADPDPAVRRLVVGALDFFRDQALVAPLLQMLNDADWQVRRDTAIVLGRLGSATAGPALLLALRDPYWQVVKEALTALGSLRYVAATEALLTLGTHPQADIRKVVAWALGELGQTMRIGIGHQSFCTDTYTGGIVVKGLQLLEKHLPRDGKYKDVTYDIVWADYTSGPPITNQMLAGKLDIGVMGDYPLLVNGARFQETRSLRSLLVSMTGYNLRGSSNSMVVPIDSKVYRFKDLKGKRVSVPFGSAAHGMLLKALLDRGLPEDYFTLVNQSPPVGATSIQEKKIDAHADFCPWGELLEFKGWGRKIFDGSEINVPYLHGVVVRKDFAEKYSEIVVAYLKAVIEASQWVTENPTLAAAKMEEWASINKEVMYLYFGPGGFLRLDTTIKPLWVETLKFDATVLQKMNIIKAMDVDTWVDDTYIKQAYQELGLDYDTQLKETVIGTSPVAGHDALTSAPVQETRLAGEIWTQNGQVLTYSSPVTILTALRTFEQDKQEIRAAYVFDYPSGLKLFAQRAFYVATQSSSAPATILVFAKKHEAEQYAAQHAGRLITLAEAKQGAAL